MSESREVEASGCTWLFLAIAALALWSISVALWEIAKHLRALAA